MIICFIFLLGGCNEIYPKSWKARKGIKEFEARNRHHERTSPQEYYRDVRQLWNRQRGQLFETVDHVLKYHLNITTIAVAVIVTIIFSSIL